MILEKSVFIKDDDKALLQDIGAVTDHRKLLNCSQIVQLYHFFGSFTIFSILVTSNNKYRVP